MPKKKRRGSQAKIMVEEVGEAGPNDTAAGELLAAGQTQDQLAKAARPRDSAGDDDGGDEDATDQLVFEDPYEDEYESDGEVVDALQNNDGEGEMEELEQQMRVWRPGIDKLGEEEVLDYDSSTYQMFHRLNVEWPCLSFDIFRDGLGEKRERFPMTMYSVAGTQVDEEDTNGRNSLVISKMSRLHKTQNDSDEEASSDSDDEDGDAILEHRTIRHDGAVNRVRCQTQAPHIVASWSDTARVSIYDVSKHLAILDTPPKMGQQGPSESMPPLQTFTGHTIEGFALDWSPVAAGRLASGDCAGMLHLWEPSEGGKWSVADAASWHKGSVEDVQWSPAEASVLASCSTDHNICIWDARVGQTKPGAKILAAHDADVNVLSWNRLVNYLLVSGGDDGLFRIWDLRTLRPTGEAPPPAAHFKHHSAPITSIEWSPHDSSCLAVAGADDQVTIWDMSVERDAEDEAEAVAAGVADIPAQLMFVHQGQRDVKEVHWHPQIPGCLMTTAADGMNVFKPSNWSHIDD